MPMTNPRMDPICRGMTFSFTHKWDCKEIKKIHLFHSHMIQYVLGLRKHKIDHPLLQSLCGFLPTIVFSQDKSLIFVTFLRYSATSLVISWNSSILIYVYKATKCNVLLTKMIFKISLRSTLIEH